MPDLVQAACTEQPAMVLFWCMASTMKAVYSVGRLQLTLSNFVKYLA